MCQFYGTTNLTWDCVSCSEVQQLSAKSWTEKKRMGKVRHDNKRENTCKYCGSFVSFFYIKLSCLSCIVYLTQMAVWGWQHFLPVVKIKAVWSYSEMKTYCVVSGGSPHERIPLDFQSRDADLWSLLVFLGRSWLIGFMLSSCLPQQNYVFKVIICEIVFFSVLVRLFIHYSS